MQEKEISKLEYWRNIRIGKAKKVLGDYQGAIESFSNAIKSDDNRFNAYFYRGNVYSIINYHEHAIIDYTETLIRKKSSFYKEFILEKRGKEFLKTFEYERALIDFNKAIDIKKSANLIFLKAFTYSKFGNLKISYRGFNKSKEINPDIFIKNQTLIDDLDPIMKVLLNLSKNQKLNINNPLINDIEIFSRCIFNKGKGINSGNIYYLRDRANIYLKLKIYIGVIDDLTKFISYCLKTNDKSKINLYTKKEIGLAFSYRGLAYYKENNIINAKKDLEQAINFNPECITNNLINKFEGKTRRFLETLNYFNKVI